LELHMAIDHFLCPQTSKQKWACLTFCYHQQLWRRFGDEVTLWLICKRRMWRLQEVIWARYHLFPEYSYFYFDLKNNYSEEVETGGIFFLSYQGAMLLARRSRARDPVRWIFSIDVILPAALGPGVHSASNRNDYQKQKNVSGEYSAAGA
jgi:hypothetical protein